MQDLFGILLVTGMLMTMVYFAKRSGPPPRFIQRNWKEFKYWFLESDDKKGD